MKKLLKWITIIFVGFIIVVGIFGDDSSQITGNNIEVNENLSEQSVPLFLMNKRR